MEKKNRSLTHLYADQHPKCDCSHVARFVRGVHSSPAMHPAAASAVKTLFNSVAVLSYTPRAQRQKKIGVGVEYNYGTPIFSRPS